MSTYELLVFININPRARVAPGPVTFTFTLSPSCRKKILHEKRDLESFILLSIAKVNKRFLHSSTKRGRGAGGSKPLKKLPYDVSF